MPTLLRALETDVALDYRQFCVEDERGAEGLVNDPARPGDWLLTGHNRLVLVSASDRSHRPAVRLEAWDGPPGPAGSHWQDQAEQAQAEAEAYFDSAVVALFALTEGEPSSEPFPLGPPGRYAVRAHRTGGDRIEALTAARPEAEPRGVERFLLQFWPSP